MRVVLRNTKLKEIFQNISKNYNISFQEWNHDIDHVYVLFKAQPNSEISKFIENQGKKR